MISRIIAFSHAFSKKSQWFLLFITFAITAYFFQCNIQFLINKLDLLGNYAPILFLLLYCLASILCLPTALLVIASGALFGPVVGLFMSLLGATLGAVCGFSISRYLMPDGYYFIENERVKNMMLQVERQGWKAVAMLRLTPVVPYNLVNYGMGLTSIKFSHYLITTIIFIIPSKILFTYGPLCQRQ